MKIILMYVGAAEMRNGTLGHEYVELDSDYNRGPSYYFKKPFSVTGIGQCMEIETEDKNTFIGRGTYIDLPGQILSAQEKLDLYAKSASIKTRLRNSKAIKALAANNEIHTCLRPLKEAYRKLQPEDRQILIAKMLEFITR